MVKDTSEAKNLRDYLTRTLPKILKQLETAAEDKNGVVLNFKFVNGKVNLERIYSAQDTWPMTCGMFDDQLGYEPNHELTEAYATVEELLDGNHPEWFEVG